jgi:UDP-N-acetylmuramate dehydrogenase
VSEVDAVAAVLGDRARRNVPLGPLTTYRVGGAADLFLEIRDIGDLAVAAEGVQATGAPVLVIGKGSNLLVSDRGFRGLALVLGEAFANIDIEGTTVRAGAAAALPVLARRTAAAGLTGFEWAVGVPGSLGGAVRMNAGGHGSEMRDCVRSADVFDLCEGQRRTLRTADLDYRYRHSSVQPTQVVLGAELGLAVGDKEASEARIAEIVRWRRENQPGGQNAGSVFTNPPGDSAGRLVDACGLKGFRVGSAHVSLKHANFVQADEGGSADDVLKLVVEVQRRVEEQTGVRLEPELRVIGFDGWAW